MNFKNPLSVLELSSKFGLEIISNLYGDMIFGINEIHKVTKGDITFFDTPKYYEKVLNSEASFIIINKKIEGIEGKCLLYSDNPFQSYNEIAKFYFPIQISTQSIAFDLKIGRSSIIYPNVFIGENVTIGENCIIYPNVTIYPNTIIGNNVIIHANTTIGSDAFYYNFQKDIYNKMHTIGRVIIHNDVEIGSNCSIDSGVSGDTIIGQGTKLDNQIQIAHGVVIGKNCLLCAQVAIAGKTKIGNHVILYGKVGVSKGLLIGDHAIILASSNVDKNLEGGKRYYGSPALEARQAMKYMAALRMMPEYLTKIKHLIYQENEQLNTN